MPDLDWMCEVCGNVGLDDGSDGFFYCQRCGSQAEDIRDTAVEEDNFIETRGSGVVVMTGKQRWGATAAESVSQAQPQSQFWDSLRTPEDDRRAGDGVGPTEPSDFGLGSRNLSYDDYYAEIRLRYVMGIQIMIELQCKALVEKYHVSPLIVGLAGPIWLRFVTLTRVFDDEWADEAIHESESQKQGKADDFTPRVKYRGEPHNILGQRAVMIWYKSLSKTIPLSHSLVISFLVCHLAREAILPTDTLKWTLEGKLPYFAAFVEIERQIGPPSSACPISSSCMFRPQSVSFQRFESLVASVAQTIGLELPPVNFYAIASRYVRQLSLPVGKIIPHACRIYEWSMPPELWLSANDLRLPTCACVMSILIVAIRILYNINGFGKWEMSLSNSCDSSSLADQNVEVEFTCNTSVNDNAKLGSPSDDMDDSSAQPCNHPLDGHQSELDAAELLKNLEAKYDELDAAELLKSLEAKYDELADTYEYSIDLPTYLQYCKNVVFAGLEPSFEDHEEEKLIEDLWDFYQNQECSSNDVAVGSLVCSSGLHRKRSRDDVRSKPEERKKFRDNGCTRNPSDDGATPLGDDFLRHSVNLDNCALRDQNSFRSDQPFLESRKDRGIRELKSNMEENRFCYIPPRVNVKNLDYIHYARKKEEGAYTYAAHADYYILLRSCAKVAQVDIRSLHTGVLSFERRLAWLEKRIDYCLHLELPNDSCEFCRDEVPVEQNASDASMGFSKLNL